MDGDEYGMETDSYEIGKDEPECVIWDCCNHDGTDPGCKAGQHKEIMTRQLQ